MGVRRVLISTDLITACLRDGLRVSEILEPVQDAKVLEVRLCAWPQRVELLIESSSFDGRAEGCRWDEIPVFSPIFRAFADYRVLAPGSYSADHLAAVLQDGRAAMMPLAELPLEDPDDRHEEVPGA